MSKPDKSQFKLEADLLSLRALVAVVEEGGFSVDLAWKAGRLTTAKVKSLLGNPLVAESGTNTVRRSSLPGEVVELKFP